jgi:DNA polymerase elongation subunit (family B)
MLPVPLYVRTAFPPSGGMKMERLERGRWIQETPPIRPYVYSRYALRSDVQTIEGIPDAQKVERKLLSTRQPTELFRYEFQTTLPVKQLEPMEQVFRLYENHVKFTDRVAIDRPDYYRQFPFPEEPREVVVDIEWKTKHGRRGDSGWVGCLDWEGNVHQWRLDGTTQYLKEFSELISQHNVVTGFNTTNYDLPNLMREAAKCGVLLPSTYLHYDIANSVIADQTLHGIKSRGLKSVLKWFGQSAKEIDGRNTENYSEKELLEYNESDLRGTKFLFNIYFPRILAVAEMAGVPVGIAVEGEQYSSTLSAIAAARGLFQRGIVSDGTNFERHPELAAFKAQGAFVSMVKEKVGRHGFTGKADVKQLYPNIILNLNLGPDTAYISKIEPMRDLQPVAFHREGNLIHYRVPDSNLQAMVTITVRQDEPSIFKEYLFKLGQIRDEAKAHLKGLSEGEQQRSPWHARENGVKVFRNALYGYNLMKKAYFSDLATGILVTAIGRTFVQALSAFVEENFPHSVIETDTDGIYFDCADMDEYRRVKESTEEFAEKWLERNFSLTERFTLDHQFFPASYFAAAKNYILLDSKGNIIRHGSGLKGAHRPNLEDIVIDEVAKKLLSGEDVVTQPYYDLSHYFREDFLMRRSLGMPIEDYDHNTVEKQVAEQLRYRGEAVEVGQILEYYQSKSGARVFLAEDHENLPSGQILQDLDENYYRRRLDRIFTTLGLKNQRLTIDIAARKAAEREVMAFLRGQYETCPRCKGLGWVWEGKGKVTVVDCTCDSGKILVVS